METKFSPAQLLRRCIFRPYLPDRGPVFSLTLWDTYQLMPGMQKDKLAYCLKMNGKALFEGNDFGCSPMHAIDSDDTVRSLMTFLTLKPGDTDDEYFEKYTAEQLDYCTKYAETLDFCAAECWRKKVAK
jgi:hypothetical protein